MDGKKLDVHDEKTANDIIARSGNEFTVSDVKTSEKSRHAPAPFTTSSMQQEAARKLGFTTKLTMLIAQQLYEGVDVAGEGTVGLITYMRTDSLRISDEAQAQAKDLICTLLAGGKRVFSEDIDKAALERGIPGRTVRDAKRELGDALKSKIVEGRKKVFWME